MSSFDAIQALRAELFTQYETLENKADILKSPKLKQLLASIRTVEPQERATFGQQVNQLSQELRARVQADEAQLAELAPIDITAPFSVNGTLPSFLPAEHGSIHPISQELTTVGTILSNMGFQIFESREIDDQYHMFEALNFPKGHPARDEYDTFMTVEKDTDGEAFIAPAHTSTMQHRIMKQLLPNLEMGLPIAASSIDRVFRNEDLDARHEHTFHQCEGIYIDKGVHAGMLVATLKSFLERYYEKELQVRINPFYFPFTEPSFEFALSCPFCDQEGCSICSQEGWIELLGCGMIHPNVLRAAGIDPDVYTGFAWGVGVERLIMMKYGIEDIRHFESAKLDFLRQF